MQQPGPRHRRCGRFGKGTYVVVAWGVSVFLLAFLIGELHYGFYDPPVPLYDTVPCITPLDASVANLTVQVRCLRFTGATECGTMHCYKARSLHPVGEDTPESFWNCRRFNRWISDPISCADSFGGGCSALLAERTHSAERIAYAVVGWITWGFGMIYVLFVCWTKNSIEGGFAADVERCMCSSSE